LALQVINWARRGANFARAAENALFIEEKRGFSEASILIDNSSKSLAVAIDSPPNLKRLPEPIKGAGFLGGGILKFADGELIAYAKKQREG
jgi:hypothetical protein